MLQIEISLKRIINEQHIKVSVMRDIPSSSYSAKGITGNYIGDAHVMAAGNQWKHLEFTLAFLKRFFSLLNLKKFS